MRAPQLPAAVDAVLDRGLAKAPEDRWPTAEAMVRALGEALGADRTEATPALPADDPGARRAAAAAAPLTRRAARPDPATPAPARRRRGAAPTPAPAATAGRRRGPALLVALVALVALCGGAAALLLGGGGGDGTGGQQDRAQREPARTTTPEPTRTAEATPEATRTPEPTATATPSPEPTATPAPTEAPTKAPPAGGDARALQLRAFALNNAGNPEQALAPAQKAVQLCDGSAAADPCAYALFELARALRLTGDPGGAIAALEQRKARFPDNQPGAVAQELARARADAG